MNQTEKEPEYTFFCGDCGLPFTDENLGGTINGKIIDWNKKVYANVSIVICRECKDRMDHFMGSNIDEAIERRRTMYEIQKVKK